MLGHNPADIDIVMDISANITHIEQINLGYKYGTIMDYLKNLVSIYTPLYNKVLKI
jgi:hypothetical protein